eukprot:1157410-Pelagomonas_calceolata.AAC.4
MAYGGALRGLEAFSTPWWQKSVRSCMGAQGEHAGRGHSWGQVYIPMQEVTLHHNYCVLWHPEHILGCYPVLYIYQKLNDAKRWHGLWRMQIDPLCCPPAAPHPTFLTSNAHSRLLEWCRGGWKVLNSNLEAVASSNASVHTTRATNLMTPCTHISTDRGYWMENMPQTLWGHAGQSARWGRQHSYPSLLQGPFLAGIASTRGGQLPNLA